MFRQDYYEFVLPVGGEAVPVLNANTDTFAFAEFDISGEVWRLSDDRRGGIKIRNGQTYIMTGADFAVAGRGQEITVYMKNAGAEPAVVRVVKSYRAGDA